MKPLDEDDIFYILFGIPQARISRVDWNVPIWGDRVGLHRRDNIQDIVLKFDPSTTTNYEDVVALCVERRLPQRGAIVE